MFPYLRFELRLSRIGAGRGSLSRAQHAASARALTGPRLRRVLGKCLIERFCPFGRPICQQQSNGSGALPPPGEQCYLARHCPYGVAFAASRSRRPPYSLYVRLARQAGDADLVELTVYGEGWRFYPWILASLRDALAGGLGKERLKWQINKVLCVGADRSEERLCGRDLSTLPATRPPNLLGLTVEPYLARQQVEVALLSPTRLILDGRLAPDRPGVGLDLLVARVLDRFAGLYGEEASDILRPEIRGPIEAAAARVPLLTDETRWVEAKDFSARSGSELRLGGKVGRLVYGEEAAPFFGILRSGEILHVGKNPASGCGRIAVDLMASGS